MTKSYWTEPQLILLKTLDQDKEKSRAYRKFKQAIKTPSTLKSYNFALDKFMIQSIENTGMFGLRQLFH